VFSFPLGDPQRRQVEEFLMAFDSDLAPIVGQQITLSSTNGAVAGPRIDLMIARATAGECDLVVKGTIADEARGARLTPAGTFQTDRASDAAITDAQLRALVTSPGQELTYSCLPPGSGLRAGIDRDGDTALDGDEMDAGTDPGSERSVPPDYITCTGGGVVDAARVSVGRNLGPGGDESFTLKGEWVVAPLAPKVDPLANGFRFKVKDKDGSDLFYHVMARGRPISRRATGWLVNRAKTSVTGKGDFRIDPAALPVAILAGLGGPEQSNLGQCATRAFFADGAGEPDCRVLFGGNSVKCN
jgi:hypothetical protein